MAKKFTYQEAHDELNDLVNELHDELVTIDILPKKIERATALIEICNLKLKGTNEQLDAAFKHLESLE